MPMNTTRVILGNIRELSSLALDAAKNKHSSRAKALSETAYNLCAGLSLIQEAAENEDRKDQT